MNPAVTTRVLVVDDDPGVRSAVSRALRVDYEVDEAADGAEALAAHAASAADAIVLDLLMPAIGGLDVCRSLRRRGDVDADPRRHGARRGRGPGRGPRRRRRRLPGQAVRGRGAARPSPRAAPPHRRRPTGFCNFADVSLDPATREAFRGERRLQLTRTEFNLLELFLRNPRQVLTRSQIYERVWGYDFGATSNALWVYIGYLRRKLEEGGEPRLLQTVRGVGYALREES